MVAGPKNTAMAEKDGDAAKEEHMAGTGGGSAGVTPFQAMPNGSHNVRSNKTLNEARKLHAHG